MEKKKRLEEQERVNVEARHREYQIVSMQIHMSGLSLACAVQCPDSEFDKLRYCIVVMTLQQNELSCKLIVDV